MKILKGNRQLQRFLSHGSAPSEGRGFEHLMLGPPAHQKRKISEKERDLVYGGGLCRFQKKIINSIEVQPRGYPWGTSGYQIDHVLRSLRARFPESEREKVLVFHTLETEMDYRLQTDCFFFYRGSFVTVDLTLRTKTEIRTTQRMHLCLRDADYAQDSALGKILDTIAQALAGEHYRPLSPSAFQIIQYRLGSVYQK